MPYYIVYGQDTTLPYELQIQSTDPLHFYDDYTRNQQLVNKHLEASRSEMIQKQRRKACPVILSIGDQVVHLIPSFFLKWDLMFDGPYVVLDSDKCNQVTVQDPQTHDPYVIHVHRLKKCSTLDTSKFPVKSIPQVEELMEKLTSPSTSPTQPTMGNDTEIHSKHLQQYVVYRHKLRTTSRSLQTANVTLKVKERSIPSSALQESLKLQTLY